MTTIDVKPTVQSRIDNYRITIKNNMLAQIAAMRRQAELGDRIIQLLDKPIPEETAKVLAEGIEFADALTDFIQQHAPGDKDNVAENLTQANKQFIDRILQGYVGQLQQEAQQPLPAQEQEQSQIEG